MKALAGETRHYAYWLPVAIAVGIAWYFTLPAEPSIWIAGAFVLTSAALVRWHTKIGIAVMALALGFAAASLRTHTIMTPMLDRDLGFARIEGVMASSEAQLPGSRMILEKAEISRQPGQWRLRISMPNAKVEDLPPPGSRVRVFADLRPPPEPSHPGGYDFRRQAFFNGIGGYGFALGKPELVQASEMRGLDLVGENLRLRISHTIAQHTSGPEGAIADALMTGDRGAIDDKTNDDMRAAGTAHLLSISGSHIGMVGGIIFFLVRFLLALTPMAMRWPIKKMAAVAALVAVVAYTWLVEYPVPAQRAAFMAGIVLVGVMVDRISMSLRSVALAAAIILLLYPESLLHPSFQLSFAAITALISFYELLSRKKTEEKPHSIPRRVLRWVGLLIATSLIAGIATAPYAAFHFHRFQVMGVLGNLIAVPITGFVVMPAALASYAAMPFGLAAWPLAVMEWGLKGVTQSAAWVAALPGANIEIPYFGLMPLLLMTFGGLWLTLWAGRVRQWGAVPVMAGIVWALLTPQPVALVSANELVAVRAENGGLFYLSRVGSRLTREEWGRAFEEAGEKSKELPKNVRCDGLGCLADVGSHSFALSRKPESLLEDCARAEVVLMPEVRAGTCGAPFVIDRAHLLKRGSTAFYRQGEKLIMRTSRDEAGQRPWEASYTSASAR